MPSSVRTTISSTCRADRSSSSPAVVATIRLPTRWKSGVFKRDSMSRNWWLSADWVRNSRSPARVTLPVSAIATTRRRWRISRSMRVMIDIHDIEWKHEHMA
jgi:hypothetical protein